MLPKRDRSDEHPVVESPKQKRRRSAEAILPENVPLPESPPSDPKVTSKAPKKMRLIPTNDEILAMSVKERGHFDMKSRWLHRAVSWDGLTTPGGGIWKGVKVLGQGTYGIAGWFQYEGPNKSIPQSLVVKQCGPRDRAALLRESRMLAELRGTGSKHIVQMFKSIFYTAGTGVHPRWDPIPYIKTVGADGTKAHIYDQNLQVSRIYLEHCQQGDLWRYDQNIHGKDHFPYEEFLWRTWECLLFLPLVKKTPDQKFPVLMPGSKRLKAKARSAGWKDFTKASLDFLVTGFSSLAIGHSAPGASIPKTEVNPFPQTPTAASDTVLGPEVVKWRPIAHFDIKPNNLFVGNSDDGHRKPERVVHKLGDFGMARHIPTPLTREFLGYSYCCGAAGYKPPGRSLICEQLYRYTRNGDVGLPGNVWSIAASLYAMIMNEVVPDKNYKVSYTNGKGQSESYDTQGAFLLFLDKNMYSNTFSNLLLRCLAFNPTDRPGLPELKRDIDDAIAILNAEEAKLQDPYFDFKGSNLMYHRDPDLEYLVKPPRPPKYSIHGSLQLDYPRRMQDARARIDVVGFAPAGSASDTIDGNTAVYSVQLVKFDLIPAIMTLEEQKAARYNANVSDFNLVG
ncbi:kinase-like protein [Cadophora sp. DSE1049]|nr:kinase-like protein [Cadophora sp. DSE1049]